MMVELLLQVALMPVATRPQVLQQLMHVNNLITFVPYPVPWAMDMNTDPSS